MGKRGKTAIPLAPRALRTLSEHQAGDDQHQHPVDEGGLSQGPRAPAGGAVVTHVLVPGQEVRVFRNPANHAETATTVTIVDVVGFLHAA